MCNRLSKLLKVLYGTPGLSGVICSHNKMSTYRIHLCLKSYIVSSLCYHVHSTCVFIKPKCLNQQKHKTVPAFHRYTVVRNHKWILQCNYWSNAMKSWKIFISYWSVIKLHYVNSSYVTKDSIKLISLILGTWLN